MAMLGESSSAVGELVGAAEVLGYFWDAEEFQEGDQEEDSCGGH
jgi:hypothetical protein